MGKLTYLKEMDSEKTICGKMYYHFKDICSLYWKFSLSTKSSCL